MQKDLIYKITTYLLSLSYSTYQKWKKKHTTIVDIASLVCVDQGMPLEEQHLTEIIGQQ